jgi:FkbM family methyltransferase
MPMTEPMFAYDAASFSRPTLDDVRYCYRLFWQQEPDAAGLEFWGQRLDYITLQTLVDNFVAGKHFAALAEQRKHPTVVQLDEYKLCVRMRDWLIGAPIAVHQVYEANVSTELHKILAPGMVCVDIGANIGFFTMLCASRVGGTGKVIAFEPNPENVELIHRSIDANGFRHVTVHQVAVADREDEFHLDWHVNTMHSNTAVQAASSPTSMRTDSGEAVKVRSVVIDHVLENESRVDVVKIDVDGWEARVLRGMATLVERHRPVLFTEFCPDLLEGISKVRPEAYLEELQRFGYVLYWLPLPGERSKSPLSVAQIMDAWRAIRSARQQHLDLVAYPT